jgi:hypothetical protein
MNSFIPSGEKTKFLGGAHSERRLALMAVVYSERRLFAGFATAAFIAWKLIVAIAMSITNIEPVAKIDQLNLILYG